ncbi:hypothetical protein EV421DRAFT_2039861 [Armillaria borealis]|uniref:F-box domain-containing protein n=1 Tax=Armillaria borealis TaxID=47425 RepID=A0AA39MHJ8_9AGAR|nr:hypothetical protein EV421DRAFT_2039861 [Armillaria borealis]
MDRVSGYPISITGAETDYRPALSAVAMLRSGTPFLPNLQKFEWCRFEDWMLSVFIMRRSITTFSLRVGFSFSEEGYEQVGRYFDFIADRMPQLEHFHLSVTDSEGCDISQFSQALELLVPRLTNLKSIQFPAFNNTYPIISATSSLSRLTDIRIEFCPPDTPLPSSGPPCILPSRLEMLHVSMTFRDAAGIFHTALPHLLEIRLIS